MNPDFLVRGVLESVLGGGRRKRSRRALRYLTGRHHSIWTHPSTLMTAAGVAWGIYETLSQQQNPNVGGGTISPGSPAAASTPTPPLPLAGNGTSADVDPAAVRLVRLVISAAHADGAMGDAERAAVLKQAQASGVADIVEREVQQRRPLAEIVAGVTDPAECATVYVLAFTVLRADEQVTGAERIYLAQLAHLLNLDPETVQKLERDTSQRIDATSEQESEAGPT